MSSGGVREAHDCNFHGAIQECINDRCPLHRAMRCLARCLRDAAALCLADEYGMKRAATIEANARLARDGKFGRAWWYPGCNWTCPGWRET